MRLDELAKIIGAEVGAEHAAIAVSACATLEAATPGTVSFLSGSKYADQLPTTKASAVIVAHGTKPLASGVALLFAKDPYFGFRQAVVALHGYRQHPHVGVHPLAYVHPTATIGEGTTIYPFAYVGPGAKVGRDCILYPSVTVYDHCILGDRVILHASTSIGHDGFGYATHALPGEAPAHHKIPQAGIAVIEDDVEMGSNCSVDRATVGQTVVAKGTKFSNNVVIGHGTKVGQHNLYVAQVGLAGSVKTGDYVVMGGQVGVAGHLSIGSQVQIAAQSGVAQDLEAKQNYLGTPAIPIAQGRRVWMHTVNLDELVKRLKSLEKQVIALRSAEGSGPGSVVSQESK